MARRPDLEGQQFQHISGTSFIYIVIDGILRWIPSSSVWNSLFTNWNVATINLVGIDGFNDALPPFPLPTDCRVVRGEQNPRVFLMDFQDPTNSASSLIKRWVQSPAAMNAYGFQWPVGNTPSQGQNFPVGSAASTVVPQVVMDGVPEPNPPGPLPLGGGLPGFPF